VEKLNREWVHAIEAAFSEATSDPRYRALRKARAADEGVELTAGWDREAVLAIMQMRSSEKTSAVLTRATWMLVVATAALAITTVVLVVVTVMQH